MTPDFGGKPFSLLHYLAIKSAYDVNDGPDIRVYYAYEPTGQWWERAKRYATPIRIEPRDTIFDVEIRHPAHRTDVHKLLQLEAHGGIAMDLDVLCLRPFNALAENDFVMAWEEGDQAALCNAVMLARPHSRFAGQWISGHDPEASLWHGFRSTGWDVHWGEMSTEYPARLAQLFPDDITTLGHRSFFPYSWRPDDIVELFGPVRSSDDHQRLEARTRDSYCIHLWEMVAWENYLRDLTVDAIVGVDTPFHLMARRYLVDH